MRLIQFLIGLTLVGISAWLAIVLPRDIVPFSLLMLMVGLFQIVMGIMFEKKESQQFTTGGKLQ